MAPRLQTKLNGRVSRCPDVHSEETLIKCSHIEPYSEHAAWRLPLYYPRSPSLHKHPPLVTFSSPGSRLFYSNQIKSLWLTIGFSPSQGSQWNLQWVTTPTCYAVDVDLHILYAWVHGHRLTSEIGYNSIATSQVRLFGMHELDFRLLPALRPPISRLAS